MLIQRLVATCRRAAAVASRSALLLLVMAGCSDSGGTADVSPQSAATAALAAYDANKDGAIDAEEQKKFSAFAAAGATIDKDGNTSISADELTSYFELVFGPANALTEFVCTVTLNGRPLEGAEVTFRPADFLPNLPAAKGTTDAEGIARPTIPKDKIPAEYSHLPLVNPGLYAVEITHPSTPLPARYNAATELGAIVSPASRSGSAARFDLKP